MEKEQAIHTVQVRVPSAAVKTLVATDVEIVPAPGAGKILEFISGYVILDFNSVAYSWANTDHDLTLGGVASVNDAAAQAVIEASSRFVARYSPAAGAATAVTENQAIKLTAGGTGEPATGNSDLVVIVNYRVHDVDEA